MKNGTTWLGGCLVVLSCVALTSQSRAQLPLSRSDRELYRDYIKTHYPEQLETPEKKKRKSFAQFGYGLSYFAFPLFPITEFIDPDNFGEHSYGKPGSKEKNGSLYTCRGGFIDFSHLRVALDWTVYLTFKILSEETTDMDLPSRDGKLKLRLRNVQKIPLDDIVSISQKVAFERLVWHELCSWYYHLPNYTFDERQSTFTPEDTYSNFLGTVVGRNVALRILLKREGLPFSQIASEEIRKELDKLLPVRDKKMTKAAYDIVDAAVQAKLPAGERNTDVWWDSRVVFRDGRYVFKRYINIGPQLQPWRVPQAFRLNCEGVKPLVLTVPQRSKSGASLYTYYTLTMSPDSALFYNKRTGARLHKPFPAFESKNMNRIVRQVEDEMRKELLSGFGKRNRVNPEGQYEDLKKMWFK